MQPGYRPYHHRTHLLLPSHTKVGSFRLTSILFRIDSRVLTSLYEALNVQAQMTCEAKEMDYLPLWFLYSIVVMNILLVINASSNFLIYLFAGNSFRDQVNYWQLLTSLFCIFHHDDHDFFAVQEDILEQQEQRGLLSCFDSWGKSFQEVTKTQSQRSHSHKGHTVTVIVTKVSQSQWQRHTVTQSQRSDFTQSQSLSHSQSNVV